MGFAAILPYLIPVLQVLWELLKPTVRKLIEQLWEKVEGEIEGALDNLEVPKVDAKAKASKVKAKVTLFNTEAKKIYADHGKTVSDADINLVREVIHNKMSKKRARKQGKTA